MVLPHRLMAFRRRCGRFLMQNAAFFFILVSWSHMELARHMSDFWDSLQQGQLAFCVIPCICGMKTTQPRSDQTPRLPPSAARLLHLAGRNCFHIRKGQRTERKQLCTLRQVGFKKEQKQENTSVQQICGTFSH